MATVISNPTTSFRSPVTHTRNSSIPSSSWSIISKKIVFPYRNQQRMGFRGGVSVRRFAVSCGVTEIDQIQFSETVLESDVPVLVEFIADWCGPCRLMAPAIDWASQEYKDKVKVLKIDHDSNPKLIEEYKVYGLPGLIFFKNGKEVPGSRREGAMTKAKLKEYIDAILESLSAV
ncbi:hypothetical protein GIB67_003509 [Kingdonia uniflora]|uniref:Thioredoxin domain-containing protein n=1 Tax=Kingdonia uniflora TaxID=39325 RepID=A0A7J7MEH1_9MAGN|nr:hypothetical protein GIB67_003509 [Kingdonia uniflora]